MVFNLASFFISIYKMYIYPARGLNLTCGNPYGGHMNTIKETYIDGVETIHVLNATVRMDMFSLQPPQGDGSPTPQVIERVIMPIQSFLNMHGAMQQIVDRMVRDGLVKPNTQQVNNWETQGLGNP